MYEDYTRQALPSRRYRELLGTALCVFNANNQFVIENILRVGGVSETWATLFNPSPDNSDGLQLNIKRTITKHSNRKIGALFGEIVAVRNRIVHSVQITENDEQILRSVDKKGIQFTITEGFLIKFIQENEKLALLLHDFRGY